MSSQGLTKQKIDTSNSMAKEVVLEDLWSSHYLSDFIWGCTFLGKLCDTKHAFEIFIAWFWN